MKSLPDLQGRLHGGTVFVGLTYGAFFVYLLLQHQLIFLFHDDYGYAVLNYVTRQTGFQGQDFTLAEAVAFLVNEYKAWTGRLASHFLHIHAQKFGLDFVRFVQSLAVTGFALLSFFLARDPERPIGSVPNMYLHTLVPVLLFLALPVRPLVDGLYWFTASFVHFWGVPFFLAAAWLARSATRLPLPCVLLFSFSASFSEGMSFAAMVYVTLFAAFGCEQGARAVVRAVIRSIPVFAVSAVTMLSPGNRVRFIASGGPELFDELGFTGVLFRNIETISGLTFQPAHDNIFALFMILGSVIMLLGLRFAPTSPRALKGGTYATVALLLIVPFLVSTPFMREQWRVTGQLAILISFSLLLLRTAGSSPAGRTIVCIHAAGLASLVPLLFAPTVSHRALMPFLTLQFAPITYAIAAQAPMRVRQALAAAVLILGGLSVKNAVTVFDGYRSNRIVHEINDAQLRVASFMQTLGMGSDEPVVLFKLKDRRFATTMPYERPLIEVWMKKYYRLDPGTEFTWVMGEYLATAARLGDLRPAVRSDFDVYLVENRLVYVKESCGEADVAARFFLHVFPVDPDDLHGAHRQHGFHNLDFGFDQRGHRFDGHCHAEVPLPDYGIAAIRTGQYIPGKGRVWEGSFDIGE